MTETRLYNKCVLPIQNNIRKIILQFKYVDKINNRRQHLKQHSDKNKMTYRKALFKLVYLTTCIIY